MKDDDKTRMYLGPNAPKYMRKIINETFPEAEKVSREEFEARMAKRIAEADAEAAKIVNAIKRTKKR